MLFHAAAQRREARRLADWIEAVATGYAGAKTEKGGKFMQRELDRLRR